MMNRHFIFALCTVLGFSVSGISMAQSVPTDKEAAAKAAKAAKVKFRWGKSLKSAQKQAEETGLPIVLLFTGTSWCGFCVKLEKEILSKKDFKQGMDGVAIGVKFEFGSSDFSKSRRITLPACRPWWWWMRMARSWAARVMFPAVLPPSTLNFSRNTHPRLRKASKAGVPERSLINRSGGRESGALFLFRQERLEICSLDCFKATIV